MRKFPVHKQVDFMDCGAACLKMVAEFYGKKFPLAYINEIGNTRRDGTSMADLADAAEKLGFRTLNVKIPFTELKKERPLPFVAYWKQSHFIIVTDIKKDKVKVVDPVVGTLTYQKSEFLRLWGDENEEGVAMLLEPSPRFYESDEVDENRLSFSFFSKYLRPYRRLFTQLFLGLIAGSLMSLMAPFLTQSLVDIGVQQRDIGFIFLVLFGQVMFFVGNAGVTIIRSWILLHVSTRLNIAIVSDFLVKLMRLPISYFDKKNTGDILQRITDHDRIKDFMTSSSLESVFSLLSMVIYGVVLLYYSFTIFLIFFLGSVLYLLWVIFFLKERKKIDYKRFNQSSLSQGKEIQLVQGMQEIKLNHAERRKREEWEIVQLKLFKVGIASLRLQQIQRVGGSFINESKNILLFFFSALQVIDGNMTLGMMLAATQIVGQLNSPLTQLIMFIQQAQDAKISFERLGDVHNRADEDQKSALATSTTINGDLEIRNLSFRYGGEHSPWVLKDINLTIPYGKTTAIVGTSGSGKTTLLKILLKFYPDYAGEIKVGSHPLSFIKASDWRKQCGVVMQEGFLFNDTIFNNICISSDVPNQDLFNQAVRIANIDEFIQDLPQGAQTKIGANSSGMSTGQMQRIMIARAVYKSPQYIFFDEATSALDAKKEKVISENLNQFNKGRTSIVIAHRLSTVKKADQIVVLEQGTVIEIGDHRSLVEKKGKYYELVKNQLELE